jgi:hypothetical protein
MSFSKQLFAIVLTTASFLSSCGDYLDIVPDKTQEIDLLFERKEAAYKALATCYNHLPANDAFYGSFVMASDELAIPSVQQTEGTDLMKGNQSASDPIMGYWSGYGATGQGQSSLWEGIRSCNILIDNIDLVKDMTTVEKEMWKAEAQVLKAQFHFLLLRNYGPIPIVDVNLPISASEEEVKVLRNTTDACFDYIVKTLDTALKSLPLKVSSSNDFGRIDQVIATAIKSKVLLYAASPLFNGNSDYENFVDAKGNKLFNTTTDPKKWEKAMDSSKEALDLAIASGSSLYTFTDSAPEFDAEDMQATEVKSLYNYRYMIAERWNSELIWGASNPVNSWWQFQASLLMKNPGSSSVEAAWQWVSPTLRMAELYYTKNGLPISEDLSFDYNNRYEVTTIPASEKFHAQEGERTAKLHLGREPRFYASLGFDRGINRTWGEKWNLKMKSGEIHGRKGFSNDYLATGYSLKKMVHPDSQGDGYNKLISYAWPTIRLGELYLNYAEAANEFSGPSQEVYDALNAIRSRSGVNNVEDAWSNLALTRSLNKHLDKKGLEEIIQQERMIELAFEGHRYHDLRRWKIADKHLNTPVKGWRVNESDEANYYQIQEVGQRIFENPRDYLHPIKIYELTVNNNLVQNPGW